MFAEWEAERAEESEKDPRILCSQLPSTREADPLHLGGKVLGCAPSLPPTSDDQDLEGGPGIGEVPLLTCFPERCWDPILIVSIWLSCNVPDITMTVGGGWAGSQESGLS